MSDTSEVRFQKSVFNGTVWIVGLGFFIDAFDLFLYNALRVVSLRDLGLQADAVTRMGLLILNAQVAGVALGGLVWGVLGDKIGRKRALVGSILLYALGSFGCAFVQDVWSYGALRLLTGVGLAGEIGLGATLILETLPREKRVWGILIFVDLAFLGVMAAMFVADHMSWRWAYGLGGGVGLLLLLGRVALCESGLFAKMELADVPRGSLRLLMANPSLQKRLFWCILLFMPYYCAANLLVTLAPEVAKAVGVVGEVKASTALLAWSLGALVASPATVFLTKWLQRRVPVIVLLMTVGLTVTAVYLLQNHPSAVSFYTLCALVGASNFYIILAVVTPEQFGTNMRATMTSLAMNIGRATLIITNSLFLLFKSHDLGILASTGLTAVIVFAIGYLGAWGVRETYAHDLDFLETRSSKGSGPEPDWAVTGPTSPVALEPSADA